MSSVAQRQTLQCRMTDGGVAGTADDKHVAVGGTGTWILEAVAAACETAITESDTNFASIEVRTEADVLLATGSTETTAQPNGVGTLTAYQGFAATIASGGGKGLEIAAPGSLRIELTKDGTGQACDDTEVTVTLRKLSV